MSKEAQKLRTEEVPPRLGEYKTDTRRKPKIRKKGFENKEGTFT
jgi:hypothetical protein